MPAFTPPPPAPQRGDRATFSQRVDAFLTWLVQLVTQLNLFVAGLNSRDAGGAKTFSYSWDGASADANPGAGNLRFSALPLSSSTVVRLANQPDNGGDISALLISLSTNASNVKAAIRFQNSKDPNSWMIFEISDFMQATGYWNLGGVVRASSSPTPFVSGDALSVFIDRSGDKGDGGGTPTQQQIRDAIGVLGESNGGTGANTFGQARTNLGINNVDNTSDANKPVSTAQAAAINTKVSKTGDSMSGTLVIDTLNRGLEIRSGGPFAEMGFVGTGGNKTIRLNANTLEVVNSANTAVITTLSDSGQLSAVQVTQTSDERLKTNWRPITDGQLEAIADMQLAGLFDWVNGGSSAGGSAQAIQRIIPEVVYETEGKLHVDYGGLNFAILQASLRRMKERGMV